MARQWIYGRPLKEAVNPVEELFGEALPQEVNLIYNILFDRCFARVNIPTP